MRLLFPLIALLLLASFAPRALFREVAPPAMPALLFRPVPLHDADPALRKVGKLTYLGGWSIRSNDGRFGGISAMHVADREVTAVSDGGFAYRFALPRAGSAEVVITPIAEGPGNSGSKEDRDAESLVVYGRRAWIGFEIANEVWRYASKDWKAQASAAPPAMRQWRANGGSEAMVRLPDGRFLVLAESGQRPDGSTDALLFADDPTKPGKPPLPLRYAAPKGYKVTDAAVLPDGRLLFLNRRASLANGFSAKLTLAKSPDLSAGGTIWGQDIADLQAPLTVDNMEALSVTSESGRTIVWIASDDNFLPLQRTLLMKFQLESE
jgi:hypothetical protein